MKSARLIGVIIVVVLTLVGLAPTVHAQSSQPPPVVNGQWSTVNNSSSPQMVNGQWSMVNGNPSSPLINSYPPNLSPETPQNMQTLTQSIIIELLGTTSCMLTGINPVNQKGECLGYNPSSGQLSYAEPKKIGGGAIGAVGNLVVTTFTQPASGIEYIAYTASNFGLTKNAYAQTVGFDQLQPILGVWSAFRNLTYLLFVIILVFIGLGIMLRVQIDPRTVMSIQNQIPKVIIALILITFSYAIAGLMIDLMWISIFLVVQTFATSTGGNPDLHNSILSMLNDPNRPPFFIISDTFPWGFLGLVYFPSVAVGTIIQQMVNDFIITAAGQAVSVIFGGMLSPIAAGATAIAGFCTFTAFKTWPICQALVVGNAMGLLGGLLAYIIIGIAVLWAMLRLWFALIRAYIFILFNIIFSPFWILAGLIPGSSGGFGPWFRDLLGNLLAFPVVFMLFALARVIMEGFTTNTNAFVAPLIGTPLNAPALGALIGLGIILIAPEAITMAREAIKAPEFKYATAIGRAVGVGSGSMTGIPGTAAGFGNTLFGVSKIPGVTKILPWLK